MTKKQQDMTVLYNEASCGNAEALRFLLLWNVYIHSIDDIVDGDKFESQHIISSFVHSSIIFGSPFYLAHLRQLQVVTMLVANAYADSVAWAKSDHKGLKTMADTLRFCGNEMILAVAFICGGWQHMRSMSERLRTLSWEEHHDEQGEPK